MTPAYREFMKILVVEDNPHLAEAVQRAGATLSMTCDYASDGWDAIEKLETEDYAAIVIDADVPHHSGFGVLTYLNEERGDDATNVIVMTSSDRDEMRRKVQHRVHVMAKTDAVSDLAEAVLRVSRRD
jgi:two-component system response regulator VanR